MTARFTMDEPQPRLLDETAQGVIHEPLDRPEGRLKVTGRARYAAENVPEGTAEGVLVRARVARGRASCADEAAVRAMPGVLGVCSDPRMLQVPAHGGAGTVEHIKQVVKHANASAVALYSLKKKKKKGMGVLINFPILSPELFK